MTGIIYDMKEIAIQKRIDVGIDADVDVDTKKKSCSMSSHVQNLPKGTQGYSRRVPLIFFWREFFSMF